MKRNLLIIVLTFFLAACSIANTPTSKVEDLLGNYQRLDDNITINYYDLSNDKNISTDLQDEYNDLIKDQYQSLSYEVKEEEIDGDVATVTASIEVMNYKDIINKYNKNSYQSAEYHRLILDDLKNASEKTTYTIDFTLTKDDNGDWHVDELSNEEKEKLLGIN